MNAYTSLAIDTFKKIVRNEKRREKLQQELEYYITLMPEDERDTYYEATKETE